MARSERRYKWRRIDGRKVLEHRHIMEDTLGRKLNRREHVHHKNGDSMDNRPENLEVLDICAHNSFHKSRFPKLRICEFCLASFAPSRNNRGTQRLCSVLCRGRALGRRSLGKPRPDVSQRMKSLALAKTRDHQGRFVKEADSHAPA